MLKDYTIVALVCLSILPTHATYAENLSIAKTKDLGLINKDKIIYWLEKRGELSKDALLAEQQVALKNYIGTNKNKNNVLPGVLGDLENKTHLATINKMKTVPNLNNKNSPLKVTELFKASTTNTDVKVLAILVDFQDLKFDDNQFTAFDTDMHYDEYPTSHYQNLLFSKTGYTGPSGQNIESAYQYYQQVSGQSFSLTGNTYGWVTADNDAKYYGANDNDENDSNVVELVIEAVEKAVAEGNLDLADYDKVSNVDNSISGPDGIVDHLMIFHSSIGEEAGGGSLASDAIWSHRFAATDSLGQPASIEGSTTKIYGYTITPIDSSTGVVVHEFAHNLGLLDEYDTASIEIGAPVSGWSVMSSGSWLGSPRGSKPNSFSPYGKEYLQTRYGGNWVNQKVIEYNEQLDQTIDINSATNHESGFNQIKINLPESTIPFGLPYSGQYQYYSGNEHDIKSTLSFSVVLGSTNTELSMKARWDIEQDYDYVQVKINGSAIPGNHTKINNPQQLSITNYLSGKSLNIAGTSGLGWVDLTYDLSSYKNKTVEVSIDYVTDPALAGYGFVADDITIKTNTTVLFSNGAENTTGIALAGFEQISEEVNDKPQNYYVELRDHTLTDSALSTLDYDPGVLLWFRSEGVDDNNVSQHPGEVFIGVVDADQNLIKRNTNIFDTERQLRDAAFSLYDQTPASNDSNLTSKSLFKDTDDYSSPAQPESGIVLPKLGLNIEILTQTTNNASATINLLRKEPNAIEVSQSGFTVNLSVLDEKTTESSSYIWHMGDDNDTQLTGAVIEHTYEDAGSYDITVNYSTESESKELLKSITVASPIEGSISINNSSSTTNFNANLSGGLGDYIYRWNFGDSQGSSSQQAGSYTYSSGGNYNVTLTVSDDTNQSYTFTENITVLNPLTTSFAEITNNLLVNFTSTSTGGSKPYSYTWDFGDNSTSTEVNPSHTYTSEGSYTVSLIVTDADGKTANSITSVKTTAAAATNNNVSSNSSGGSITWLLALTGLLLRNRVKSNNA